MAVHRSAMTRLDPVPASAAAARRFVASGLRDQGIPEPAVADVMLLTSEIVANAVSHARTVIELRLTVEPSSVRVEVEDASVREPRRREVAADIATRGRGLMIVEEIADAWGTDPLEQGKVVWFEVGVHPMKETT